jgi:ribulose-phosphate 3-epimerase
VSRDNAPALVEAGADVLVAGSFVFHSPDPVATLADLRAQLTASVGVDAQDTF